MTALERLGFWVGRQAVGAVNGFLALPGRMQLAFVVVLALLATQVTPVLVRRWYERRELRRLLAARRARLRWGPGVRP